MSPRRPTRLSARALNRTLLLRQQLLERRPARVPELVHHLLGLQAQEGHSPYLGLAARIDDLDPEQVSRGLTDRSLVRLVTLRGTVHLLTADDALALRTWTQPCQDRELRSSQAVRPALGVDRSAFTDAVSHLLADGPMPQGDLAARLAERFPGVPATALGQLARVLLPLAQLPPRGCWKQSGGVVYQYVDRWVGAPRTTPDVRELVTRYLRAFGPAGAADMTTWSGITRLGPVFTAMERDGELVRHEDEQGRALHDVPDGPLAEGDVPAPPRLLGTYDNLWLSHARKDRVTTPEGRRLWMGVNGGNGRVLLVDGMLTGLWRVVDGRVEVDTLLRRLTRAEQAAVAEEVARVEALLAR